MWFLAPQVLIQRLLHGTHIMSWLQYLAQAVTSFLPPNSRLPSSRQWYSFLSSVVFLLPLICLRSSCCLPFSCQSLFFLLSVMVLSLVTSFLPSVSCLSSSYHLSLFFLALVFLPQYSSFLSSALSFLLSVAVFPPVSHLLSSGQVSFFLLSVPFFPPVRYVPSPCHCLPSF